MKNVIRRTAVAALAGVMAAGMLTGCGEKKLDGTKTVATVDGTEIPMGVVSLYARQQQAQTAAMYMSFMGSAANIWDQTADEDSGETYGEQAVQDSLEAVELMYIMKSKAADYGVAFTEEDEQAAAEAAAAFMAANDEETIAELAVTEEQVKTLLELETYRQRIYEPINEEANVVISDDEANQSAFTYVSISISGDELTEEDIAQKKEQAQEILDKVKEDPAADMDEIANSVDESYSALSGTFTTKKSEDEDGESSSYPEEVLDVLRGLGEGEAAPEVIETETSYYVVRLDKLLDEEATESKRESLKTTKENEYYREKTQQWLDEADICVDKKVLKTLTITDSHTFTIQTAQEEDVAEEPEIAEETDVPAAEDADAEEIDATEEAEVTEEPEEPVTEDPEAAEEPAEE